VATGESRGEGGALGPFLGRCVEHGWMPGASYWVGRPGRGLAHGAVGCVAARGEPVTEATPFDLASLTKPLATATLYLLLEQEGTIDGRACIETWLPEAAGTALGRMPLARLASHDSGLPAWAPLAARARDLAGYLAEIVRLAATEPGPRGIYSDLGYILLGAVLERAAGADLARLFERRVAQPLGLLRTGFGAKGREDAAATEEGNDYERVMAGAAGAGYRWRARIPRGEVHDANAHGLGGTAGHAGLFGTAEEVARLCGEWLEPERLPLGVHARERLLRTASRDGRTFGLVLAAYSRAARGVLADDAPGHTGFTGTSLWLDPRIGGIYVLLTNRVHPRVMPRDFQWLRRGFHRLAGRRLRQGG